MPKHEHESLDPEVEAAIDTVVAEATALAENHKLELANLDHFTANWVELVGTFDRTAAEVRLKIQNKLKPTP